MSYRINYPTVYVSVWVDIYVKLLSLVLESDIVRTRDMQNGFTSIGLLVGQL